MQKLGLSVNKAKSCLVLMQTITYIGMLLDSRLMSAVLQLIAHIRLGVSLHYYSITTTSGDVRLGCSNFEGHFCDTTVLAPPQATLVVEQQFAVEPRQISSPLDSCLTSLYSGILMSGVPLGVIPFRREVVTIDYSLFGWGATWNHRRVCGQWCTIRSRNHVNLLELHAVFLALQCFLPVLAGCHVLI